MITFDWVIIGAGVTGLTFAEQKASEGNTVLIIDKNNHIGGHCYDEYNIDGILIHKYGPHVFHTNSKEVWDYLSQFTTWNLYYQKTLVDIDGKKIKIPINIESLYQLFSSKKAQFLEDALIKEFGYGSRKHIYDLKECTTPEIKEFAEFILEKVFVPYTFKQWGLHVNELDRSVTGRVPVVISRDDRYFNDKYQALPKNGYTRMFKNMTKNKNIHIMLNTNGLDILNLFPKSKILYTGAIDEFFDYKYGKLPYKSMRVKHETLDVPEYQEAATINYPESYDFVRIVEYKKITGQIHEKTAISKEYPEDYVKDANLAAYPILTEKNQTIFKNYKKEINNLKNIYFSGRLADYKYYNIDQAVAKALKLAKKV